MKLIGTMQGEKNYIVTRNGNKIGMAFAKYTNKTVGFHKVSGTTYEAIILGKRIDHCSRNRLLKQIKAMFD